MEKLPDFHNNLLDTKQVKSQKALLAFVGGISPRLMMAAKKVLKM